MHRWRPGSARSPRPKATMSSTRIGKRPCSSGIRSDGFERWNAPDAMNSTWSVRSIPYFVVTVVPSTSGSRSRCTPCRDTSTPCDTLARSDLVDLVEEHDAVLLGGGERARLDLLVVQELAGLLLGQKLQRVAHLHLLRAPRPPESCWNMPCSWLVRSSMPGRRHDLHLRRPSARPRSRSPCRRACPRAASCGISAASPNPSAACR